MATTRYHYGTAAFDGAEIIKESRVLFFPPAAALPILYVHHVYYVCPFAIDGFCLCGCIVVREWICAGPLVSRRPAR